MKAKKKSSQCFFTNPNCEVTATAALAFYISDTGVEPAIFSV